MPIGVFRDHPLVTFTHTYVYFGMKSLKWQQRAARKSVSNSENFIFQIVVLTCSLIFHCIRVVILTCIILLLHNIIHSGKYKLQICT